MNAREFVVSENPDQFAARIFQRRYPTPACLPPGLAAAVRDIRRVDSPRYARALVQPRLTVFVVTLVDGSSRAFDQMARSGIPSTRSMSIRNWLIAEIQNWVPVWLEGAPRQFANPEVSRDTVQNP